MVSQITCRWVLASVFISTTQIYGGLFVGLGDLPGGQEASMAMDVSSDGRFVVGAASRETYLDEYGRELNRFESVRWSIEHGIQVLGSLPNEYTSNAWGVSADGLAVVGRSNQMGILEPPAQSFVWTEDLGIRSVAGTIGGPCEGHSAEAVSGDGLTVVGRSFYRDIPGYGCEAQAYAVVGDNAMLPLGFRDSDSTAHRGLQGSSASAVSFDGSVIAGESHSGFSRFRGWIWTAESGLKDIGAPEGHRDVRVWGMPQNGEYAIGQSRRSSDDGWTGFIWTETNGMSPIPIYRPTDVSDQGMVIGRSRDENQIRKVSVWSVESGMRNLEDLVALDLIASGQIAGWDLNDKGLAFTNYRITPDSRTIVGSAINPDGGTEAWLAILSESGIDGDFNEDGQLDATDINLMSVQLRRNTTNPIFDLDGDSVVNDKDRQSWIAASANTYFGDANLDGEFNSSDFVAVFAAGEYEDAIAENSGWADGKAFQNGSSSLAAYPTARTGLWEPWVRNRPRPPGPPPLRKCPSPQR